MIYLKASLRSLPTDLLKHLERESQEDEIDLAAKSFFIMKITYSC